MAGRCQVDLASLEPVPGVVGVGIVAAEDHLEDAVVGDAGLLAEAAHGREGRVHEDAPEVEEDGLRPVGKRHDHRSAGSLRATQADPVRSGNAPAAARVTDAAPGVETRLPGAPGPG